MQFNYMISDSRNPYKNLAIEQCLFEYGKEERGILFLWQNENTIVIGKNQNVFSECKAEEFTASGGLIARRRSGGGAVYHDRENLNFSFICKSTEVKKDFYCKVIMDALKAFDLKIAFNGRNDLTIDGKKFSGNAAFEDGTISCQHGTILIATDIEKMAYYLTPDASKLERNHVKSVSSRVVNLCEINKKITVASMQDAIIKATNAKPLQFEIEKEKIERKKKFFSAKEWIYGGVK